jgi:hypothetical protein
MIELHSPDSSSLFHVNRRTIVRQMCLSIKSLKTQKFLIKGDCRDECTFVQSSANACTFAGQYCPAILPGTYLVTATALASKHKRSLVYLTIKALLKNTYRSNSSNAHNHVWGTTRTERKSWSSVPWSRHKHSCGKWGPTVGITMTSTTMVRRGLVCQNKGNLRMFWKSPSMLDGFLLQAVRHGSGLSELLLFIRWNYWFIVLVLCKSWWLVGKYCTIHINARLLKVCSSILILTYFLLLRCRFPSSFLITQGVFEKGGHEPIRRFGNVDRFAIRGSNSARTCSVRLQTQPSHRGWRSWAHILTLWWKSRSRNYKGSRL